MSESSASYLTFWIQTLNELSFHESQPLGKPQTPQSVNNTPPYLPNLSDVKN